jgi:beta-lysine 5,6-aminomutase beta subunit
MPEIVPYGDTAGDGMLQLSFTLPIPSDGRAREIGLAFLRANGHVEPQIVHLAPADRDMTFFVAYARAARGIDPDTVVGSEVEAPAMGFAEINALVERELGRRIVVIGAAIESDAHTVGIDAIMNMKGFAGDYGLERYPWFEAVNLGAQVRCERLLREAEERAADAILVSQVVTQKQVHARQLTKLCDLLEAEGVRARYLLVCGGPRLSNTFAKELGYDAGFGPGSTPSQVAAWIAAEVVRRSANAPTPPETPAGS